MKLHPFDLYSVSVCSIPLYDRQCINCSTPFYRASACYAYRARYCFSKSVRLSVCPTLVLYLNECTYRQTPPSGRVMTVQRYRHYKFSREPLSVEALNTRGWEKSATFSTEIAVYEIC